MDPSRAAVPGLRSSAVDVSRRAYLDVGCSTGTLLSAFSDRFDKLVGIDLDPELLKLAAKKMLPGERKKVELLEEDARALPHCSRGGISLVTCLGNTLPHLTGPGEVGKFLSSVRDLLERDGVFVFQTINYDRVLDGGLRGLPTIERGEVSFERYYSALRDDGLIDFDTIFTDPENEIEEKYSFPLVPIRRNKSRMHRAGGFSWYRLSAASTEARSRVSPS
jgi:SAM-dependent methyltransferase